MTLEEAKQQAVAEFGPSGDVIERPHAKTEAQRYAAGRRYRPDADWIVRTVAFGSTPEEALEGARAKKL